MNSANNKLALVTGAAGGLGLEIAARLGREGFQIALLDIEQTGVCTAANGIDNARGYACDITDAPQVEKVMLQIEQDFNMNPEVLINNAGIVRFGNLLDHSVDDFRKVVEVNLVGTFIMCRCVGRLMAARGNGVIVNITSLNAYAPSPDAGAYPATKSAVAKLTEQLALTLGPQGVRVNAVAPGFINSGMSSPIYQDPEVLAIRGASVPAGRIGTAEDVAGTVAFLVSDQADYIHGLQILVDGGVSCSLKNHLPRKAPTLSEK